MMLDHVILTGASGYVGNYVLNELTSRGLRVTSLVRNPSGSNSQLKEIHWRFGKPLHKSMFLQCEPSRTALIHIAHSWEGVRSETYEDDENYCATQSLLTVSRNLGIKKFVFISSQSSRIDAPNYYGRLKYSIENLLNNENEISLRVGLVFGGQKTAMYSTLCKISKLPFLPIVYPINLVQPIHVSVLARCIADLTVSKVSGTHNLGALRPIKFTRFLKCLARSLYCKPIYFVPIPLKLALLGVEVLNRIPFLNFRIDKERILGLSGTKPMEISETVKNSDIGMNDLDFERQLYRTNKRGLLIEGRKILRMISVTKNSSSFSIRPYVRASLTSERLCRPALGFCCVHKRITYVLSLFSLTTSTLVHDKIALSCLINEGEITKKYLRQENKGRRRNTRHWSIVFIMLSQVPIVLCNVIKRVLNARKR